MSQFQQLNAGSLDHSISFCWFALTVSALSQPILTSQGAQLLMQTKHSRIILCLTILAFKVRCAPVVTLQESASISPNLAASTSALMRLTATEPLSSAHHSSQQPQAGSSIASLTLWHGNDLYLLSFGVLVCIQP